VSVLAAAELFVLAMHATCTTACQLPPTAHTSCCLLLLAWPDTYNVMTLQGVCMGPARNSSDERLAMAWKRTHSQFSQDYNDRLFTGLLVAAIAAIVVFRFLVKIQILEIVAWFCLVLLEIYPRIYRGPGGLYDTTVWKAAAVVWEAAMVLLFSVKGLLLLVVAGGGWVWAWQRIKQRRRKKLLPQAYSHGNVRDLDV
jgi:hypothetical protein